MARRPRLLPFAYLLALSAVVAILALVGAVLDRLPLVPGAVSRAYGSGLVRLAAWLTAPVDAWGPGPAPSPPADATAGSPPRHN